MITDKKGLVEKDAFSGLFHEPKSNRIHVKVYLLRALTFLAFSF